MKSNFPEPYEIITVKLKKYDRFIVSDNTVTAFKRLLIGIFLLASTGLILNIKPVLFGCLVGLTAMAIPLLISVLAIQLKMKYLAEQIVKCEEQIKRIKREKAERKSNANNEHNS